MKRAYDWTRSERELAAVRDQLSKPATIRQLKALNRKVKRLYDERVTYLHDELYPAIKALDVVFNRAIALLLRPVKRRRGNVARRGRGLQ